MIHFIKEYFRFLIPVFLMIILIVTGTVGYMIISGYDFFDAFYMTVITITTVGYGEVQPLTSAGKIFTILLIITSFGTFAYAVSALTKFVIDGELNTFFKTKKMNATVDKLSGHIIICGFGRNGKQASQILKQHNKPFVIIEESKEVIGTNTNDPHELIIEGDATLDDVLVKAGVMRAKALITTLPEDASNLFIVLTARNLNKNLTIISRASEDSSDAKLKIAGANNVIMPDKVGGAHMAGLVMKPDVIEFLDYITTQTTGRIGLEEIAFDSIPDKYKNKTLKDFEVRNKSGATIIGFKSPNGEYTVNPGPDTVIMPNSKIFVLGNEQQISLLRELLTA